MQRTAMSFLKSLPIEAGLLEIHQAFPKSARPLLEYQEALLRGESPFSAAERELIAAYVSGLNNCDYCCAIHSQVAVALGIPANTIDQMFANAENAEIDSKMRPVLALARKVTLSPAKNTTADNDPIFAAECTAQSQHDAIADSRHF